MCSLKAIIAHESDVADDAEPVGEDSKFVHVAEMPVDVHLFCIRAGSSLGWHETVSHLVRVNIRLILIVSLEATDEGVKGFGVVFGDIELNA